MQQKAKKSNIVGLKDLRENMETYIKRVEQGEHLTVVRRSTAVFRLSPATDDVLQWETVADFTQVEPEGVSGRVILDRIRLGYG